MTRADVDPPEVDVNKKPLSVLCNWLSQEYRAKGLNSFSDSDASNSCESREWRTRRRSGLLPQALRNLNLARVTCFSGTGE